MSTSFLAQDALLAVEVADTSLDYDRSVKLSRYAAARVPEVWIVDLPSCHLEVYRTPVNAAYADLSILEASDQVTVPADGPLRVADILPSA